MGSAGADNPFLGIGPPPTADNPEAQVQYFRSVVGAFQSTGNPRIKPLQKKLEDALQRLAAGAQRGSDPTELARRFGGEVDALRVQTYDLLLTVVNQVRATLRVKLQKGMAKPTRVDTEKLQKALALFSQGLRKTLLADRKGDAKAREEAQQMLNDASVALEETGHQLNSA